MLLLKSNRISELGPLKAPNLLELDLEGNTIAKMDTFEGHSKLTYLNLSKNKLTDLTHLKDMPFLKTLLLVLHI